jgi:DNA-binding NtrC family response regulator
MGKRVLVIELSRTTRVIFTCHLQQLGHQVTTFKDYEAAIAAFPRLRLQPPDLAFVALHPEWAESVQALIQLKVVCPQTTLIMMVTQQDSQKLLAQRLAGGVLAVPLLKPFRIQDVLTLMVAPMQTSTEEEAQERQTER